MITGTAEFRFSAPICDCARARIKTRLEKDDCGEWRFIFTCKHCGDRVSFKAEKLQIQHVIETY